MWRNRQNPTVRLDFACIEDADKLADIDPWCDLREFQQQCFGDDQKDQYCGDNIYDAQGDSCYRQRFCESAMRLFQVCDGAQSFPQITGAKCKDQKHESQHQEKFLVADNKIKMGTVRDLIVDKAS